MPFCLRRKEKQPKCQEWDSSPCPFGPVPETGALDQLGHLDVVILIRYIYFKSLLLIYFSLEMENYFNDYLNERWVIFYVIYMTVDIL